MYAKRHSIVTSIFLLCRKVCSSSKINLMDKYSLPSSYSFPPHTKSHGQYSPLRKIIISKLTINIPSLTVFLCLSSSPILFLSPLVIPSFTTITATPSAAAYTTKTPALLFHNDHSYSSASPFTATNFISFATRSPWELRL